MDSSGQAVVVAVVDGRLEATVIPEGVDLVRAIEALGHSHTGFEANPRKRIELRGAPTFSGLNGPCWGGDATPLRYETAAANDHLSC